MSGPIKEELKRTFIVSAGWLFADLLLVLAILFLAANTLDFPKPKVTPTPKAHATATPTPATGRILELNYCRLVFSQINQNAFINNGDYAKQTLEPLINGKTFLTGRKVGTAIAYGGVGDGTEGDASSVASNVYNVLRDLGTKGPIFKETSYYDPLFTHNYSNSQIVIDVYLLAQSRSSETCDATNHNLLS